LNQTRIKSRPALLAALFAVGVLLSGCAGTKAYKEGNALLSQGQLEPGLAKLQEAIALEPSNAQFRITYLNTKFSIASSLNARGEVARRLGKFDEAEKTFQQVLLIDPANSVAKQNLAALTQDRRHKLMIAEAEDLFKKGKVQDMQDALEKLRPILTENPDQADALSLKARITEKQNKEKTAEGRLAQAFRKPITIQFRDAPIRTVFDFISKVSGLNFFFDRDVRPDLKATILTKNNSIEDVIATVLSTNQLEQAILNDNSILIYPNTPQKSKEYKQLTVRTFFLANGDVKTVSYTIKTLLKARDIVTDERLGLIIMRDTPEMIRMAERIIAVQDIRDPEVMLEVEVLEIKRTRTDSLGIRWPDTAGLSLAGLTKSVGGVTSGLTLGDLRGINADNINLAIGGVTLNAKREDSDSNILANPRIRVRNKGKAKILIGDRVPVFTTTSTATGFVAESVTYTEVGLKLEAEPNVYLDGEIGIKLSLEVSNIVREVRSTTGTLSYQIGTRQASTELRLKDGENQVLAGLISDEDRRASFKVPAVGELPVLNRLFGSQNDDTSRSEIVLSITPHILHNIQRPDIGEAEFNSGSELNVGGRGVSSISSAGAGTDVRPPQRQQSFDLGNGGLLPPPPSQQPRSPLTGGSEDGEDVPPPPPPQQPQEQSQPQSQPQPQQRIPPGIPRGVPLAEDKGGGGIAPIKPKQ
jgi:general secretion pathway protein D